MEWFAQAPANIALIKYMGKQNVEKNLPDNPSLSYTLPHLLSSVMLELMTTTHDVWEPLDTPGALIFDLPLASQQRYLKYLAALKAHFNFTGGFILRSSNNFPYGSGLASSASSFAALTKCAVQALCDLTNVQLPSILEQANLSRIGSGSSCRSFFPFWVLWDGDIVQSVELPYKDLMHQVILISHEVKKISSSQAHQLVKTSYLYAERSHRASGNLKLLLQALSIQDWHGAFTIVWQEFHDMHNLFTTSAEPFNYITPQSQEILDLMYNFWEKNGDGPLVTMDAGPNIHLLYRHDQMELAQRIKCDYFIGNYDVI